MSNCDEELTVEIVKNEISEEMKQASNIQLLESELVLLIKLLISVLSKY